MYWVTDENVTRSLQEPNPVFPLGAMVNVCKFNVLATVQNITTANNKHQLFLDYL